MTTSTDYKKREGDVQMTVCLSSAFYFVKTNIDFIFKQLETKFLGGKITKNVTWEINILNLGLLAL